jgi:peptidoglycan/LPS O-acetylase OafA/YrhL
MAGFAVTLAALRISSASGAIPYETWQIAAHFFPGLRDLLGAPSIDGIIWTLEIELKFYVVCALIARLLRGGSLWTFTVPAVLLTTVIAFHQQPWGTATKLLAFNAEYMMFMFVGVAFNFLFRQCIRRTTFAAVAAGTLLLFFAGMFISGEPNKVMMSYGAAFALFSVAAMLATSWPKTRLLSFLADVSYPLYVVHGVAGYAILAHMITAGAAPLMAIIAALSFAMGVSWMLHVLVETPAHRLGQRLAKGIGRSTIDPPISSTIS